MDEQSRKWMVLVSSTWIQAFTGTNIDFSSYSSNLKSVMEISQLQLNYLAVASDMGKLFGWCSGIFLLHSPLWIVLFIAAFMGLFGYGLQWLVIIRVISLPYFAVFLLCLLAGCSICWFNTICYVLCIKNFPDNRPLALAFSISFNGVSAALYNLIADSIQSGNYTLYLLLNAIIPLIISLISVLPIILHQPSNIQPLSSQAIRRDSLIFLFLNVLAVITGLYLLILDQIETTSSIARALLAGAIILLLLPLFTPWIIQTSSIGRGSPSSFNLIDMGNFDVHKELIETNEGINDGFLLEEKKEGCCDCVVEKDQLVMLGDEHSSKRLLSRTDFWLYYVSYFCGGTVGLVYSNNIGQIAQSLGYGTSTTSVVALYSACSFFGRLLSATPDILRDKMYFSRTGWLAMSIVPLPFAFLILIISGSKVVLCVATAIVGLSSGFVFAAAVSVTSELFGPNSAGVNHNLLITNIPMGSVMLGLLAAVVYDANIQGSSFLKAMFVGVETSMVCMGRGCYTMTFVVWGLLSMLGILSSWLLFVRTKHVYHLVERKRSSFIFY
ncbi:protein NUCLEAR FUSION DEFECTIVE 4-like [Impatiens glandulifera]|uniref:protein NUCLEAR FUSION DEFECTIVE 4-like n=1 Tax=Impatiens glandulifera TaxID=253017 RepID=UPI001FB1A0F9|nr:protein NUCLEAR FUSION DEFECTIVE 4-like [Impatiens glandulifera]